MAARILSPSPSQRRYISAVSTTLCRVAVSAAPHSIMAPKMAANAAAVAAWFKAFMIYFFDCDAVRLAACK